MTEFGGDETHLRRRSVPDQRWREELKGERPKVQLVVAPHRVAFEEWCHSRNLNWADRKVVKYVQSWTDLRGYSPDDAELVVLPRWSEGKTDYDIANMEHEITGFRRREGNRG